MVQKIGNDSSRGTKKHDVIVSKRMVSGNRFKKDGFWHSNLKPECGAGHSLLKEMFFKVQGVQRKTRKCEANL